MTACITTDKWLAVDSFIKTWVRDPQPYCNNCGFPFIPDGAACCEYPQYGTNAEYMKALIKQNKIRQESRTNEFASNDDKSIRLGVSILPRLLYDLERYCEREMKQKLWVDDKELVEFMKKFPYFCIPKKV